MNETERDYTRVAQAIGFLEREAPEQPSLDDVARHVGLSGGHFQRLFRRWAGVSPKRFLQHLTTARARELLADSRSVLDVSLDTGLSGPGRLHDLFVAVEAMTPGEHKAGGAGLRIRYGLAPSPFGPCLVARTERGICGLEFVDADPSEAFDALAEEWPEAELEEDEESARRTAEQVFSEPRGVHGSPLLLHLKGTNFQIQVWRALLSIPRGSVASYEDVAAGLGKPSAARAVGRAVGANPVAFLVPCHRVITKAGELGGYRWGELRKRVLLARELARASA